MKEQTFRDAIAEATRKGFPIVIRTKDNTNIHQFTAVQCDPQHIVNINLFEPSTGYVKVALVKRIDLDRATEVSSHLRGLTPKQLKEGIRKAKGLAPDIVTFIDYSDIAAVSMKYVDGSCHFQPYQYVVGG